MTNSAREAELKAIRIPIYRGGIGWRLFLIHQESQENLASLNSVEELKPMKAVQGHDWPDTTILRHNGFHVEVTSSYPSMFRMLKRGRVDYFPRSVKEVWAELATHKDEGVIVDSGWLLQYPTAAYFFVNKNNRSLAKDLEQGLEQMIKTGQYQRLFGEYFDPILKRAALDQRRVVKLTNPFLPQMTPLNRPELWESLPH